MKNLKKMNNLKNRIKQLKKKKIMVLFNIVLDDQGYMLRII